MSKPNWNDATKDSKGVHQLTPWYRLRYLLIDRIMSTQQWLKNLNIGCANDDLQALKSQIEVNWDHPQFVKEIADDLLKVIQQRWSKCPKCGAKTVVHGSTSENVRLECSKCAWREG